MVTKKRLVVPKETVPERIPQHRHCQMCHKAIPLEETMCSEACRLQWQGMMRKKRNQLIFIWVMAAIVLLIAVFTYMR